MAAMVQRDFRESRSRHVALPPEDDPKTFAFIRAYLYCISFRCDRHDGISAAACTVHRWQLMDLFRVLLCYVTNFSHMPDVAAVKSVLRVAHLPELPLSFKKFFWKGVAFKFHWFLDSPLFRGPRHHSLSKEEAMLEDRFSRPFSGAWDLAASHGMAAMFMSYVRKLVSFPNMNIYLLELILVYLEPRISDDHEIQQLINEQLVYTESPASVFSFDMSTVPSHASRRALQFFAISTSNGWHHHRSAERNGERWRSPIWPRPLGFGGNHRQFLNVFEESAYVSFRILRHIPPMGALRIVTLVSAWSDFSLDDCYMFRELVEQYNFTLSFVVDECSCEDAPRAVSETCVVPLSFSDDDDDIGSEIAFPALDVGLSKHSPLSRCTGVFSYKYERMY